MSKLKCPHCGYEFADTDEQIKHFNEEVNKAAKTKAAELLEKEKLEYKSKTNDEINEYKNRIIKLESDLALKEEQFKSKLNENINNKNREIDILKEQIKNADTEKELAVKNAIQDKENEIGKLENTIKINEVNANANLKEEIRKAEKNAQDKIDDLQHRLDLASDYKTRMNVKDLGEDLEQYCANKFNAIRTNTYPNAYFEKDNDTKVNGEKGDFIFRDYVGEGDSKTEFISIMFDMKNEDRDGKTKHKTEDFFKKLDSDRKAKGCEYAVLVSMLELGNDFYDQGIADVSYKYPKMFVVRPNHFLTIIALLRNAALSNAKTKLELVEYQKQNFDITNFEKEWNTWKGDWGKNINHAKDHFTKAINDIDASIKKMQSIREELVGTINQLGYADNKVEELTLRKLAKNSPSIKEELKKNK